jgi:hypothetical protein
MRFWQTICGVPSLLLIASSAAGQAAHGDVATAVARAQQHLLATVDSEVQANSSSLAATTADLYSPPYDNNPEAQRHRLGAPLRDFLNDACQQMTGAPAVLCRETRARNSCQRAISNRRLIICDLDDDRGAFMDSTLVAVERTYCNSAEWLNFNLFELRYWRYVRHRLGEGRTTEDLGKTSTRWRSGRVVLTRVWTRDVTYWYLDLPRSAQPALLSNQLREQLTCDTSDEE